MCYYKRLTLGLAKLMAFITCFYYTGVTTAKVSLLRPCHYSKGATTAMMVLSLFLLYDKNTCKIWLLTSLLAILRPTTLFRTCQTVRIPDAALIEISGARRKTWTLTGSIVDRLTRLQSAQRAATFVRPQTVAVLSATAAEIAWAVGNWWTLALFCADGEKTVWLLTRETTILSAATFF